MSSHDNSVSQSNDIPPVSSVDSPPEFSASLLQAGHDSEPQKSQATTPNGPEQEASTGDEHPPSIEVPIKQSSSGDCGSHQQNSTDAAATNGDDGDISLVTSPRMDESASSIGTASSSHRRIDSLPPQKYSVTHDATNALSTAFASASLHAPIEENDEEVDISLQHDQDSADTGIGSRHSTAHRFFDHHQDSEPLSSSLTIDKADLNFVDITLDAPEHRSSLDANMLKPTNPLAGSTRTSEQIRRDSVCSQDVHPSIGASSPSVEQDSVLAASAYLSKHELSTPPSPDHGDASANHNVEGRYRGRRSATTSRAGSPACSPSPSPSVSRRASIAPPEEALSEPSAGRRRSFAPAPVLLAADEHGNISVVSDVSVGPRPKSEEDQGAGVEPQESRQSDSAISVSTTTETQAEPRPSQLSSKVASSLSDEVTAADAAETSKASETAPSENTASPLAPPSRDTSHASTTPGLSDRADQVVSKTRRKSSSAGTDPVESRTRMTNLPAKPKTEEIKHRADFERMMIAAKEAERRKRDEEEERKRRRQDEQREALGRWEKEILPSWSRARKDPELEQLWWQGAPPSIRGRVWALAIGNPLMLPRNLLEQSEKKAAGSEARSVEEVIPRRVMGQIHADVEETLPSLRLFQVNGPLHGDLVRMCCAFVLVRMEQVAELDLAGDADRAASQHHSASPVSHTLDLDGDGEEDEYARRGIDIYQRGLASLAAVLLINMSIGSAFIALLNLLHSKPWLKALYSLLPTIVPPASPALSAARKVGSAYALSPKEKAIRGFERVFETLLADQMPKVYANLLAHNVQLYRVVLRDWVATLWSRWLDVDTVMRVWDVVLLDESEGMIYRVCLALVQMLESRLYGDAQELESVLKGRNAAALAVWRRDKELRGELLSTSSAASESDRHTVQAVPRDYVYEQYAIQEHHVFETLDAQKAWWKQSTLQRLLDRELSE